jgi:diguanylate cyclase (GGDEF)-like protein
MGMKPGIAANCLRHVRRILTILVFALALSASFAAAADISVAALEDASGTLRVEQVSSPSNAGRFSPVRWDAINFGLSKSAYWLRFTIAAGDTHTLLEVATPYLDLLDFYRPHPGGGFDLVATGDHRPYATREIDYRHPVFRLAAPNTGESIHYLRVQSAGALQLPLRFWATDEFHAAAIQEHYVFGLFYGLVLVMVLYNLFLFLGIRDQAYLWYVVYVALFGLFVYARNGFAFQWLWPDSAWLGNNAHYLLIASAIAAATQFTRHFLDTPARTPRLDKSLRVTAAFGLVVAAATIAGWQRTTVLLIQAHSLVAVGLGIAAAVLVWRSGYAPARYYLIAFATIMASSLFSVARNLGLFPANFLSTYGVQVGSALEIVLLALGLADRINVLKREKELAQAAAMRSQQIAFAALQEHEHELERRVRQRTEELAEANEMLRQREQALEHMAHHDVLTGLANRALLEDRLQQALARARRNRESIALLLIDLDKFKEINDTHGHEHGDAMLVAVAGRLCATVRDCDTVARLGGDEFVILIGEMHDAGDCDIVATKLLSAIVEPVHFRDVELRCSVSIGAAIFPANGHDSATLFRQADEAMYAAKRAGRAAYQRAPSEPPESAV